MFVHVLDHDLDVYYYKCSPDLSLKCPGSPKSYSNKVSCPLDERHVHSNTDPSLNMCLIMLPLFTTDPLVVIVAKSLVLVSDQSQLFHILVEFIML